MAVQLRDIHPATKLFYKVSASGQSNGNLTETYSKIFSSNNNTKTVSVTDDFGWTNEKKYSETFFVRAQNGESLLRFYDFDFEESFWCNDSSSGKRNPV